MDKYLYIRVSTAQQNIDRQLEDVKKLGIPDDNVFIDKMSGKDFNRPEYQRMIATAKEGDIIYFHSIDRMGRNYDDIITQWQYITKELKADIIILDMPLLDTTTKNSDLTGKLIADIVLQLLSYVAQKERESIRQRQKEGIACAMERGAFVKKELDADQLSELKAAVDRKEISVSEAARQLGITRKTWYKRVAKI